MLESASQFVTNILSAPVTLTAGLLLLLVGGHAMVEGAVRIARRLGVSTLLIGLTVVAFGTSSPELAFNITAAANGHEDLGFGNIVGSNIANIALVLGVAAMIRPISVHGTVIRKELPLLIVVSVGMIVLAWSPLTRLETESGSTYGVTRVDGLVLVGGFALFGWLWYRMGKADRADPFAVEAAAEGQADGPETPPSRLPIAVALFLVGLLTLLVGAKAAELGAVGIAKTLGLSETVIGLTIVAFATSLPELVTVIVAARRGHADLAVGSILGSNQFNILLVLGATVLVAPVPVPADGGWWDLAVMMTLTLLLVPMVLTHGRRITRREGIVLLLCYLVYVTWRVVVEKT